MTKRRLVPYLIIIILFSSIYLLTMVLPIETLYNPDHMFVGYKLPLQMAIFVYFLPALIIVSNAVEIFTTRNDQFLIRLLKSILTIILSYLFSYIIFKMLDIKTWNLFWHHRGVPAKIFIVMTLAFSSTGIFVLEFIKKIITSLLLDKLLMKKYIPNCLWLDKNNL